MGLDTSVSGQRRVEGIWPW